MAQPTAAAKNAKPIRFFMGLLLQAWRKTTHRATFVCDAHHEKSLFKFAA